MSEINKESPTSKNLRDSSCPVYETPTLSLAAFLSINGLKLIKAERHFRKNQQGQEFVFSFEDPEGKAQEIAIKFVSSESSRYDSALQRIRSLMNSNRGRKS